MASLVEFPKAPVSPIIVSFMRCRESRPFLGSFESRPKQEQVIAFIPYLDLPHYVLDEEKAIAFITEDGFRGWMAKDDVSANFDMMTPEHIDCSIFFSLFKNQGWEATPILWSAIDWDRHFKLRTDDEEFDMTPGAFFSECDLVTDCKWCGHPMMNDGRKNRILSKDTFIKETKCEACNWSDEDEEKDRRKRESFLNLPSIEFDENTSVGYKLGDEWA